MMSTQSKGGPVPGHPNLRPFVKGDPRINRGGLDPKTRRVRKRLAKLDDKALELLETMMDSGQPDLVIEALKFWGKYRLPVPQERPNDPNQDALREGVAKALSPALAGRLAALDS